MGSRQLRSGARDAFCRVPLSPRTKIFDSTTVLRPGFSAVESLAGCGGFSGFRLCGTTRIWILWTTSEICASFASDCQLRASATGCLGISALLRSSCGLEGLDFITSWPFSRESPRKHPRVNPGRGRERIFHSVMTKALRSNMRRSLHVVPCDGVGLRWGDEFRSPTPSGF